MALDTEAILDRLRAVLTAGAGSFRTITAGRFVSRIYDGMTDNQLAGAALELAGTSAAIDVHARIAGPHPQRPMQPATIDLLQLEVRIRVARYLHPESKLDETIRDDIAGSASDDASVITGALEWPDNLSTSTTGMLYLRHTSTDEPRQAQAETGQVVITEHRFAGAVQVSY